MELSIKYSTWAWLPFAATGLVFKSANFLQEKSNTGISAHNTGYFIFIFFILVVLVFEVMLKYRPKNPMTGSHNTSSSSAHYRFQTRWPGFRSQTTTPDPARAYGSRSTIRYCMRKLKTPSGSVFH